MDLQDKFKDLNGKSYENSDSFILLQRKRTGWEKFKGFFKGISDWFVGLFS